MKELKYGWLIVLSLLVFAACGTSEGENVDDDAQTAGASNETATEGVPEVPVEADDTPIATIEMEDGGEITVELYPEIAPISVNNFVALAEDGFYDGLRFHRIIEGFMIQGGDQMGMVQADLDTALKVNLKAMALKMTLVMSWCSFNGEITRNGYGWLPVFYCPR